jgi:hypothetical protein
VSTPKGGSRKGAGRKPKHGARKLERTVRMLPETWAVIAKIARDSRCSQSEIIELLLRCELQLPKLQ